MKQQTIRWLSLGLAACAAVSACVGLFWSTDGVPRAVTSIYGEAVTLYGDGLYANDTLLKAGATKGTDVLALAVAALLILLATAWRKRRFAPFLQSGALMFLLYFSTCLVMGISYNRLFPLYIVQFGLAIFALIGSLHTLYHQRSFAQGKKLKGTGIFLIIAGCSTLIWLSFIVPAALTGEPMEIIEIYTSEPTFALDLGIILPFALWCGVGLLRGKPAARQIAPSLLTLLSGMGLAVIAQNIAQTVLGIVLEPGQLIGLVGSWVVLGAFATVLQVRMMRDLA